MSTENYHFSFEQAPSADEPIIVVYHQPTQETHSTVPGFWDQAERSIEEYGPIIPIASAAIVIGALATAVVGGYLHHHRRHQERLARRRDQEQ